ncbi:tRNA (adenine(22)-N(1))-methyltransferase [Staphylococcus simulans]|uniref:tRNA (adenine(22)-N(1))-methyltransferase n=1 Tax=Staphylococcus simulans TaxID=1286 RepID=UPI0021D1D7FE|nr:tRNA (adenine(22)-N(1))-methyltransferase TrmK [Staphylococcus simulans]UXR31598.1 tRNA (adenine(22)-N(1))-methyltransferase TrmK [Staphylococcus simulans]
MMILNQRLTAVSKYITGDVLADIGSDHAYLPIYAIENELCTSAIAGEVVKGPYQTALDNVKKYSMQNRIDVKLGDGLNVLEKTNNVNTITICGMGGPLIAEILQNGKEKLMNQPRLALQSNIQTSTLRRTLMQLDYHIIDEEIMEEKGHIYEIVIAEYGHKELKEVELKFGPILMNSKSALFIKKWNRELEALKNIQSHLDKNKHQSRLEEINHEIKLIQEVLS